MYDLDEILIQSVKVKASDMYIRQKFFCHKHNFLETQITQNKENHIVGMVEAGSECGIHLQCELPSVCCIY